MNNKPESQLPWSEYMEDGIGYDWTDKLGLHVNMFNDKNQSYILHACNAYPKLISMLKLLNDSSRLGSISMVDDLLKELGE